MHRVLRRGKLDPPGPPPQAATRNCTRLLPVPFGRLPALLVPGSWHGGPAAGLAPGRQPCVCSEAWVANAGPGDRCLTSREPIQPAGLPWTPTLAVPGTFPDGAHFTHVGSASLVGCVPFGRLGLEACRLPAMPAAWYPARGRAFHACGADHWTAPVLPREFPAYISLTASAVSQGCGSRAHGAATWLGGHGNPPTEEGTRPCRMHPFR